ncbi:MAG: hypothetical protein JWP81_5142 [Ferruginibacter sp.]|nr:hypothetical protein [Ferruginibacter sp.]
MILNMLQRGLISLIISIVIAANCHGQINYIDSNLIQWDSIDKIKWENFLSKNDSSLSAAESNTFIQPKFYLRADSVFCRIISFFNPNKSWKKEQILNANYGLNHEQIHFDITEIFARRIRKQIINSKTSEQNEYTIQKIYQENVIACNYFQDLYDSETEHSLNRLNQDKWNKKVKESILSLSEYKEQSIHIKFPICKICWK